MMIMRNTTRAFCTEMSAVVVQFLGIPIRNRNYCGVLSGVFAVC